MGKVMIQDLHTNVRNNEIRPTFSGPAGNLPGLGVSFPLYLFVLLIKPARPVSCT